MPKFSYTTSNRKNAAKSFQTLPKGAYVCKILKATEEPNKDGKGSHIEIAFDIAEGEYKDFYLKQYNANSNEDKKWPWDARYYLSIPSEDAAEWQIQNWDTFWTNVEDSNKDYCFDGDGDKLKGKLFGGLFHIEENESNGNVYEHTRLKWTRAAQDIRDNNYGKLPNDKRVSVSTTPKASDDGFMDIPDGAADSIPFI